MNSAPTKQFVQGNLAPSNSKSNWILASAWILFVGSAAFGAVAFGPGPGLTAFGDISLCMVALFATFALLSNIRIRPARSQAFWLLFGLGLGTWLLGQIIWTYFEVVLHQDVPNPFVGDVILFLHSVPMIGALALRPHDRHEDLRTHLGYVDFTLLLVWWVYLYLFVVIPWQYISPNVDLYGTAFDTLEGVENLLLAVGLGALYLRARNEWKTVYAHLFCAAFLLAIGAYISNIAIDKNLYYAGGAFDLPLMAALTWFGTAGLMAHQLRPQSELNILQRRPPSAWPARLAIASVFSMPIMALWAAIVSAAPREVREFRVALTQITIIVVGLLIIVRQRLVDRERMRLLRASDNALENLKRLQAQMIQTEKLVSLGQLAAGAAHEINNPLTGILGYSELLAGDPNLTDKQRALADKVAALARRIKMLVTNLLSFARRVPAEKTLIDVGQVITSALNLNNLDVRGKNIRIEFTAAPELPHVRGDGNQIMQVFFNLVDNAVDALEEVGGGVLTIRALHEDANIIIEVADTGPGIKSPEHVFDPFFTTKPVGKGTGLGLSICYGIVQEHFGTIECINRPSGGATFRVTLPVAAPGLPSSVLAEVHQA
jgi:signal transduction histidine kinase